jgi:hypothetical protein
LAIQLPARPGASESYSRIETLCEWRPRPIARGRPSTDDGDQVGTRRVKAGHRDLGNGFFEDVYSDEPICRERPVYRTRVAYDVQRWLPPGPAVGAVKRGGWSVRELK